MSQTMQTLADCGPIGLIFVFALALIAFSVCYMVAVAVGYALSYTKCPLCGCRAKKADGATECDRCGSFSDHFA